MRTVGINTQPQIGKVESPYAEGKSRNTKKPPRPWAEDARNPFQNIKEEVFNHEMFERAKRKEGITKGEIGPGRWNQAKKSLEMGLRRPDSSGRFGHSGLIWDLRVGNFNVSVGGRIEDAKASDDDPIHVPWVGRSDGKPFTITAAAEQAVADAESPDGRRQLAGELNSGPAAPSQSDDPAVDTSFDAQDVRDLRDRVLREIAERRGQAVFRNELLSAYESRCAVSGCKVKDVLEAAHIAPYKGERSNHVTNGILLRADLHTLFDLGLISVNPENMCVVVSPRLLSTEYGQLNGQKIHSPSAPLRRPSKEALRWHLTEIAGFQ
jgi:HNH endonuclease